MHELFDTSDQEPDVPTLDEAVDVAVEVLTDYGEDRGNSRIERLARWVVYNIAYVGKPTSSSKEPFVEETDDEAIGVRLPSDWPGPWYMPEEARRIAVALLLAACRAEE